MGASALRVVTWWILGNVAVAFVGRPWASPRLSPLRATETEEPPVRRLLADMQFLGPMRFITMGGTAILETVAEVDQVSYKDMDEGKTTMATIKSTDSTFEAHLRLEQVDRVVMESKQKGDRTLYAIRFVDRDTKPALVCLLHAEEDGAYDESTVKYWEGLRRTFGPELLVNN
mmetsp:Transcript_8151/g.21146  ORF Transcript_8151/g.21146 Transcript_8151/m.21146 type:complete len:173 (-) Transcript_8151:256-774(-)